MSRAQLQASTGVLFDATPEHFFDAELPAVLRARRAEARAVGGRYGFIIGHRQWLVDLDYARVEGDRYTGVVEELDGIEVVVTLEARDLERILRGSHERAPSLKIVKGDRAALERLREFLRGD